MFSHFSMISSSEPGPCLFPVSTFMALWAAAATRRLFLFLQVFSACFPTVTFRLGQIVVYYEHEPGALLLVF